MRRRYNSYSGHTDFVPYAVFVTVIFLAVFLVTSMGGCSDPEGARRILESQGHTQVETLGYSYFSCGESDVYATQFRALSPTGTPVSGTVCQGLWKDYTIRWK
jgi:hypothetical protein